MSSQFLMYLSRAITLLLVLPLHEAAHGLVAKWMGDDTAEMQGRITLNPFKHLDPIGTLLMLISGFGWAKPVPINPIRMKSYRGGIALTALAGPVSNLLAAIVTALAHSLLVCTEKFAEANTVFAYTGKITMPVCVLLILSYLTYINVGLAIFNLIPIPPLDGFNVLRYFTSEKVDRWFYVHQREISVVFLIVILGISRLPAKYNFLSLLSQKLVNVIWMLVDWIPEMRWGL